MIQALAFICALYIPSANAMSSSRVPEHYENKAWDATKPPVIDEPAIDTKLGTAAWAKVEKQPSPYCDSRRSWKAAPSSRLEAAGVKEEVVEVRGAFGRFRICLLPEPENGKAQGQGWIDLGSWDSGLEARDRRVIRYVFGTEQPDQSVAPFEFEVTPWKLPAPAPKKGKPKADVWDAVAKGNVDFRGLTIPLEIPVKVSALGNTVKLSSAGPAKLPFWSSAIEQGFKEMMALCNHHFLATFSVVSFDLNLVPASAVTPGKTKSK